MVSNGNAHLITLSANETMLFDPRNIIAFDTSLKIRIPSQQLEPETQSNVLPKTTNLNFITRMQTRIQNAKVIMSSSQALKTFSIQVSKNCFKSIKNGTINSWQRLIELVFGYKVIKFIIFVDIRKW